jgi:hypothetical protein
MKERHDVDHTGYARDHCASEFNGARIVCSKYRQDTIDCEFFVEA